MKKLSILLFMCLSLSALHAQKKISGQWEGSLAFGGGSLKIVFHFEQKSDGSLSGTMDSPDQGAYGITCDRVDIHGDTVIAQIFKINGGYTGVIINDSTLNGNWKQGNKALPMNLHKRNGLPKTELPKLSTSAHNISGIWSGKLATGSFHLTLAFHIDQQSDKTYSGKMDSPDQGVLGVDCDHVIITNDSVDIEVKPGIGMTGRLINDTTISGSWNQGGKMLPFVVNKVKQAPQIPSRPQTPKPPFKYNSEDVEYDNADKSVHFGATFTYPKGKGPFPTVILITGSGQQDRDETIFGHKSFAVIADYLSNRGIAVLRVDDRGIGKSTGDVVHATSADFADDVEVGLKYLKTRKEVDQKKMGMIGHSEGGLIASIVAARNPDIDFVIMLAGPGVKGSEIIIKQTHDIYISDGVPVEAVNAYCVIFKKILEDFMASDDSAMVHKKVFADYDAWSRQQSKETLTALKINTDSNGENKIIHDFMEGFSSPWTNYFIKTDPQPFIEKFKCKVLALNGEKDLQVNADMNLKAIHDALSKSKSPSFETKELPGLNHLFQDCKKCTVPEYQELEETFSPAALEVMWKWTEKHVM